MEKLLSEIRNCTVCAAEMPVSPRPILSADADARIVLIGQAPGKRVFENGIPWNDPSGDTLREWLGVDREEFYDTSKFAIIPMGFCYPGKGKSGDLPPRKECAPLWHKPLLSSLKNVRFTILIGNYSQAYYLEERVGKTLTETVRAFEDYLPRYFPLPHPSPRNRIWMARNPWFAAEVLPRLREHVKRALA